MGDIHRRQTGLCEIGISTILAKGEICLKLALGIPYSAACGNQRVSTQHGSTQLDVGATVPWLAELQARTRPHLAGHNKECKLVVVLLERPLHES